MPKLPKTLTEAAKSGSRRDVLVALRDKLASTIETCESGRDVAALSRRLMDVCAELETIPDKSAPKSPLQQMREQYGGKG